MNSSKMIVGMKYSSYIQINYRWITLTKGSGAKVENQLWPEDLWATTDHRRSMVSASGVAVYNQISFFLY